MTSTATMSQPTMTSAPAETEAVPTDPNQAILGDIWFYTVGLACGGIGLVGIVANCLSVIIWSGRKARRYPCVPYFIALAVYDNLFLAALLCFVSSSEINRRFVDNDEALFNFYMPSRIFSPCFMNIVAFGSVYTTAALATDRCLAVARPLTWPQTCGVKRTVVALVLVLAWSVFVNVPIALEGKLVWVFDRGQNRTFVWYVDTDYGTGYFHTHVYVMYLYPAVSFAIPVISIFITSLVLVYKVCRRTESLVRAGLPTAAARKRRAAAHSDAQCLTWQVVVISFLAFLTRCLITAHYIWLAVDPFSLGCGIFTALCDVILTVNASVNFFCFLYFTRTFRLLFLRRFPCWLTCGQSYRRRLTGTDGNGMSVAVVTMSEASLSRRPADSRGPVQLTRYRCR